MNLNIQESSWLLGRNLKDRNLSLNINDQNISLMLGSK